MVTIDEFAAGLAAIPEEGFTHHGVLGYLRDHRVDPATLHPYLYFCSEKYTRNLILRTPLFELIAICWDVGQVSSIHNHRGQECWMGVAMGRLEVRNYRLIEKDERVHTCRLQPSVRYFMDPAHPAAVDPNEPIHSVHNLIEDGERAVSVHVYSLPFDSCEIYQPEKGCYYDVPLGYTTRHGVLCPGEQAEAV